MCWIHLSASFLFAFIIERFIINHLVSGERSSQFPLMFRHAMFSIEETLVACVAVAQHIWAWKGDLITSLYLSQRINF
ncbi:hypothetical protein E2C01_072345 [Portunus trituberculatus]|uniref:Uncharacterized protein n=1 Tax=Portunus trituberculatus TaxID=210409 RepID=A0A5B7I7G3_PORTR|nr:hypothetical protein [Portunus trituberculatus]